MTEVRQFGDWTIPENGPILYKDAPLKLTPVHQKILGSLISHPGQLHTPQQLMALTSSKAFDHKVVDVQVCTLRRTLRQNGITTALEALQTIWGRGYVWWPNGNPYALDERFIARWTPLVKRRILDLILAQEVEEGFCKINLLTDDEITSWKADWLLSKA